jgi:tyrosinase
MAGAPVRIRKDVWKLATWDPILEWYGKAVAEMLKRPISDPTSWRYQAAIHDYAVGRDPLAKVGEGLPPVAQQQKFWRQCQHGTWFFLPWHRMYLWNFEQIVAATIATLGGPEDWALPYWNYSDAANPNAAKLPPAFREKKTLSGAANALRIEQRAAACNSGNLVGDADETDLEPALAETVFTTSATGGSPGFGGPKTGFQHSGGQAGTLERVPHGSMHVAVGGTGWMSAFNTAPLDPIFWLHHANLDRLWEVWLLRTPPARTNPIENAWLKNVSFAFHDKSAQPVTMTTQQVLVTSADPLRYKYEDVADPIVVAPPQGLQEGVHGVAMPEKKIPEMVAATDKPVELTKGTVSRTLSINPPTGPAAAAGLEATPRQAPQRIYLNLENITGSGIPGGYAVYLNLPEDERHRDHPELFGGFLPMFGLAESSQPDNEHGGAGLHYSLNVTDVVRRLSAQPGWNPESLRVAFVARGDGDATADVRVGRISLYYA